MIYWYGAGTEILDETDLAGNLTNEYIYFGGRRIARRDSSGSVYYYMEDFLGSSRVIATAAGGVCYDADFYPFGGERAYANTCPQNYKFEGKERDAETGNDDFGARYYSSSTGRWLSADWSAIPAPVPYANFTNPQTLNLYAMVHDNPETFADLDGHEMLGGAGAERDAWHSDYGSGVPIGGDSSPSNPESVNEHQQQQQAKNSPPTGTVTRTVGPLYCNGGSMQGEVNYNGHAVTDPNVRDALMDLSISSRHPVIVTSGDRNRPLGMGAGLNSLHLRGRAADFHLRYLSDEQAFSALRTNHFIQQGFGLLRHGPFTETDGPHLHIEHRFTIRAATYGVEGLTPQTRGVYTRLDEE